ncbi:zinc knuckle CX2CX4HX4C containing protein [Tanacetum coccineum]
MGLKLLPLLQMHACIARAQGTVADGSSHRRKRKSHTPCGILSSGVGIPSRDGPGKRDAKTPEVVPRLAFSQQLEDLEEDEAESLGKRSRRYIARERELAEEKLRRDYFGDENTPPMYPEEYFRRRGIILLILVVMREFKATFVKLLKGIAPAAIIDRQLPFEYIITSKSTDVVMVSFCLLQSRMSNTSDKGTTFGDGAARAGMQLRSSPKVSTSSPLVSPSTIINVPRELYSIDVTATFGVPLTTVGDLHKLINDIDAGKHDELLSELTNEDHIETLEALGSICNSIKVDRNNADVIPCKVSYADDSINLNVDESTILSDPIVQSMDINKSTSYAGVAGGSAKDQPNVNSNSRTLVADPVFDGVNISIPRKVVEKVSTRFEHTLYGYFIGKRMVFPVVEYYARNNWAKHGLKRIMMNSKGFFFFKFDSRAGLEAVLEGGPWLIRKSPIILKKWSMDTRLLKEELTRILIWVKLHDVPIQVFKEDGISLIATFIGKPVMLDSYTSSMCNDSWGRSSFAQCLIEVNSEVDLVDVVTIGIPSLSKDDFTKETICVEYEWRPPRCDTCKIFGHVHDYCPKKVVSPPIVATSNVVTPNAEKTNDGFQTLTLKRRHVSHGESTLIGGFCSQITHISSTSCHNHRVTAWQSSSVHNDPTANIQDPMIAMIGWQRLKDWQRLKGPRSFSLSL